MWLWLSGGFHKGPILALDVCSMRPIVITSGMDRTLRLWNYIKGRCDLVHDCKVSPHTVPLRSVMLIRLIDASKPHYLDV